MMTIDIKQSRQLNTNVRLVRMYREYSQSYIAHQLKVSQNAYSKMELGHTQFTTNRLHQLADILAIDPVQLIVLTPKELGIFLINQY